MVVELGVDVLDRAVDDGVEADFSMGNVRVMRNRLTNVFMGLATEGAVVNAKPASETDARPTPSAAAASDIP